METSRKEHLDESDDMHLVLRWRRLFYDRLYQEEYCTSALLVGQGVEISLFDAWGAAPNNKNMVLH